MLELIARRRDSLRREIASMNRQNEVIVFCHMSADGSVSQTDWNDPKKLAAIEERLAIYNQSTMKIDDEGALISFLGLMSNLEKSGVTETQRKEYRKCLDILEHRCDADFDPLTDFL